VWPFTSLELAADQTHRETGQREAAVKISLYTVADAAIVREEVYYHTPPHASGSSAALDVEP
jgi:hypothetical protein